MRLKTSLILLINILLISTQIIFAQGELVKRDSSKVISDSLGLNRQLSDSLSIADSMSQLSIPDSLILIKQIGITRNNNNSTVAYKDDIEMSDYRYTGDITATLPFGFLQDLGNAGQPSEVQFYGLGYNNIGFMQDGIGINNRITNSYDLNQFQTEYIDSIEVLNLTSGFIYNRMNNPVSINLVTRDSLSPVPYSRFRFYQAPNSEEYVDVIFNAQVSKRFNVAFGITNISNDARYTNTEFTTWKASTRVRYMLSNKINLVGSYDYSKLWQGLSGGVDVNNIIPDVDETTEDILYNTTQAPVYYGVDGNNYPLRYQIERKHNLSLKALGNFIPNNPTDITFYYQFSLEEFRQNEKETSSTIPYKFENSKFNNIGLSLRQILTFGNLNIDFLGGVENTKVKSDIYSIDRTISSYYAGGKISYEFFDKLLTPSLYLKQLQYDDESYFGSGFDLTVLITNKIKFFGGISYFDRPYNVYEAKFINTPDRVNFDYEEFSAIELGLKFDLPIIKGSISYFDLERKGMAEAILTEQSDSLLLREVSHYNYSHLKSKGFNFNSQIKYSTFLLTANVTHILSDRTDNLQVVPDWTFNGGLYYVDTLFNNNLRLKTGINLKYVGAQSYFLYDHQQSAQVRYRYVPNSPSFDQISNSMTESGYQVDLFLAGKIQNAAIVYLVFENVTGSDYYIAPYYPKQTRGIKVGLSWEFLD